MSNVLAQLQKRRRQSSLGTDNGISTSPLGPTLADDLIKRTERQLGLKLPRFLRRLYTTVANGGFGPGYGLFHIATAEPGATDLVGSYLYVTGQDPSVGANPKWRWPREYVPVISHGCGAYEVVDCADAAGRMLVHHPDILSVRRGTMAETFASLAESVEARMSAWLDGNNLVEPILQAFRDRLQRR